MFLRKEQLIRLVAEANAVLSEDDRDDMANSMNVPRTELDRLFEINECHWEAIKRALEIRKLLNNI
jgi:hypothetical protein